MKIETLRKLAAREEIDYQFLISALADYAYPRDKISAWLKSGDLIRIKKGLYIFGKNIALTSYSHEVLANLIYGPSTVSLSYALSYHGLIPERVNIITSITSKRNKSFTTPAGEFTYTYLNQAKYPVGIELISSSKFHKFLMASPEKALCDYIHLTDKQIIFNSQDEIKAYLFNDLRIDETVLKTFRIEKLLKISTAYHDERLIQLTKFIKTWKRK